MLVCRSSRTRIFTGLALLGALFVGSPTLLAALQDTSDETTQEPAAATSAAPAATTALELLERGLPGLEAGDAEVALDAWLQYGPQERNPRALGQSEVLTKIQAVYGAYEGYDLIVQQEISPRVQILVAALNFAKAPLFTRFQVYRTQDGTWVATEVRFQADATQLLPDSLVFGAQ